MDYYRQVYSGLDFTADLGGLFGAVDPICKVLLAVLNYHSLYQFIMGDLFYQRASPDEDEKSKKKKKLAKNDVQWHPCNSLRLAMLASIERRKNTDRRNKTQGCCNHSRKRRQKAKAVN